MNEVRRRVLLRRGTTTAGTWRFTLSVFQNRCAYCGQAHQYLSKDHVVPLSRGGFDIPKNVVPACQRCNLSKGQQDVRAWMNSRGFDYPLFVLKWLELQRAL